MVIRGDDNGQNFIVQEGLTEPEATALHQRLLRGHKQWYSVLAYAPEARPDLIQAYSLRV